MEAPPTTRATRVLSAGMLVALAWGCGSGAPAERETPQGVVLVLLDTVRADHLSCYGYERQTTPSIDALAAEGVLFERVVSSAPWTLPSVGALLTGDHPSRAFDEKLEMRSSLVERIQAAGIATAAVTEGGYVSRQFRMDRGFDFYHEEEGAVRLLKEGEEPASLEESAASIALVFATAKAWIDQHADEAFFLLIHTYEPHTPYADRYFAEGMDVGRIGPAFRIEHLRGLRSGRITPNAAERDYITALYDGDLKRADAEVGGLVEHLRTLGLAERVAIVVTSDHGEELGEAYPTAMFDHGHSLRDGNLLTPLVIHDPTRAAQRPRITTQVGLIDVMPTILELFGIEAEPELAGRSLLPLIRGEEDAHRVAFSSATKRGPQRISIRNGSYKLIAVKGPAPAKAAPLGVEIPEFQLYDLEADPGETNNIAADHPRLVEVLGAALDNWANQVQGAAAALQPHIENETLRERLRSLGYTD